MPDGIQKGDSILAQQMKPRGFQFGPTEGGTYGGGTSPVKTFDTILPEQFGMLAMWSGDGLLAITDQTYPTDAPADGIVYGRNGLSQTWVPVASGSGIPEAPTTGLTYTRNGEAAQWQPLPYIIPEAPNDGQVYNRNGLNHNWSVAFNQQIANTLYAPLGTVSFPEAPQDGIAYARRGWDHSWQPVATGTGVPEAPPTGANYTRNGAAQSWTQAFTQGQAANLFAPISTVSFPEVPNNGIAYDRVFGTWVPSFTQQAASVLYAPAWTVSFPEAPTDGRDYARRGVDNSWQAIPPYTPGIPEAPATGALYLRDGLTTGWVDVQTIILDGGTF
jgi:hypothetical protein